MRELPYLLHVAWMGPNPMERKTIQTLERTKSVLTGFQLKIWNNNTFGEIYTSGDKSFGSFLEAATATKNWQAVNDFVKVFVSVKYGGWLLIPPMNLFLHHSRLQECPLFLDLGALTVN